MLRKYLNSNPSSMSSRTQRSGDAGPVGCSLRLAFINDGPRITCGVTQPFD